MNATTLIRASQRAQTAAWDQEIARRLEEIDSARVKMVREHAGRSWEPTVVGRSVELHVQAIDEAHAAREWYASRSRVAASEAIDQELDRAIELILEAPPASPLSGQCLTGRGPGNGRTNPKSP